MAIKFGRPIEARTRLTPVEAGSQRAASTCPPACAATGATTGRAAWCARTQLTTDDLIWPLFVMDGDNKRAADRLHARASSGFPSTRRCARRSAPPS